MNNAKIDDLKEEIESIRFADGLYFKRANSRSWQGQICWNHFQQIQERFPLLRRKLYPPYSELQAIAVL